MSNQELLLEYLRNDGCYLENRHFKLRSGRHSDTYIEARTCMIYSETRKAFANAMASKLSHFNPTMLASSTVGGILLASETAPLLGVPLLVGQQTENSVVWGRSEGGDPDFSNVAIIDVIFTTGQTLKWGIHALNEKGARLVGAFVAIDRSQSGENEFEVDGSRYKVQSLIQRPLNIWYTDDCPKCQEGETITNLQKPDTDFLSVILSMPPEKSDEILEGYLKVYELQQNKDQIDKINCWRPWLQILLAGLPRDRVGEDSGLANFIGLLHQKESDPNKKRVFTELVGHLLAISNIKIESRSLGSSILITDEDVMLPPLEQVDKPDDVSIGRFEPLIPYYDALPETKAVFVFSKDGTLRGIKRLSRPTDSGFESGIYVLRQLTRGTDTVGLVLRRKRKAIAVYRDAKLEAIAELSEKTGFWQFNTTLSTKIKEIDDQLPGIGRTLERVLEISREMVNRGYGGLFVIGDIPTTLQPNIPKALQIKKAKIKMRKVPLEAMEIELAAEIAKLDGAMLISKAGIIQQATVIIINKSGAQSSAISQTGGSRRETARRTSIECKNAVVVCVSQNGTIDIFKDGKFTSVSESISIMPSNK